MAEVEAIAGSAQRVVYVRPVSISLSVRFGHPKSYDVNGENPCPTCRSVSEQSSGCRSRRGTIGDLSPNFSLATDHRANKNRMLLVLAAATHPSSGPFRATISKDEEKAVDASPVTLFCEKSNDRGGL